MEVKYLKNHEIDYSIWDETITNSHNSLIYAYSWYLDIVSPNWEALVLDNYEYVMPLTVKFKYGFKFIAQPPLTQQLGVFSSKFISKEIIHEFIKKIPYFSYDINLNEKNESSDFQPMANYILDLNVKYESIASNYSKNHKKNIRTALRENVIIESNISSDIFLNFFLHQEKNYLLPENDFVIKLINKATEKNAIVNYGAYTLEKELIGVLALLKTEKRVVVFMSYLNSIGRKLSAFYLIIDEVIKTHSDKDYILDFEGSQIENIAYFNKGFNAIYTPYYKVKKHSVVSVMEKMRIIKNKLSI